MGDSARFWDRHAEGYSKRPVANEAVYQKKLQITREYLTPTMEVLEFGCGTGSTAIAHARWVKHILAIDFSSKMIEIARAKAQARDIRNITFETAAIDDFTPGRTFDAVLGLNVLHLLADRQAVIRKVYALLEPGGVFVTSTVCLGDSLRVLKYVAPVGQLLGLMPLLKTFSMRELTQEMNEAGFTIDYQWSPGPSKVTTIFLIARRADGRGCPITPRRT